MVPFRYLLSWLGMLISKLWLDNSLVSSQQLLQTVDIANVYADQKTFVDKVRILPWQWLYAIMLINSLQPTRKPSLAVLADFKNISSSTTYSEIVNFLDVDFNGEGQELEAVALPSDYNASPPFLNNITSPLAKAFAQVVHEFWPQLIRATNASTLCGSSGKCESTLIPLNHTFVIPGSCFYYAHEDNFDNHHQVEDSENNTTGTVSGLSRALFNHSCTRSWTELFKTLWTNWNYLVLSQMVVVSIVRSLIYYSYTTFQLNLSWLDLDRSQPPLFIQVTSSFFHAGLASPSWVFPSRCYQIMFKQAETRAFLPALYPLQRSESYRLIITEKYV